MQRKARAEVKLSNGTVIPKGGFLAVSTHRHWDDAVYPNANECEQPPKIIPTVPSTYIALPCK